MNGLNVARKRLYRFIFDEVKEQIEAELKMGFDDFCIKAQKRELTKNEIWTACELADISYIQLISIGCAYAPGTELTI